jgi:septal ring factor EnvC (AmiA/AmiB activator)
MDEEAEIQTFESTIRVLASEDSPLLRTDETTKAARGRYREWCEIVKDVSNDVLEYQRLKTELEEVETRARELDLQLAAKRDELKEARESVASVQGETNDAKDFHDAARRWVDASLRIAMQREQVNQKEADFLHGTGAASADGRDLKQVDQDLEDLNRKKDEYADKKNQLNTEMAAINDRVASYSQAATRLETQLRNMEAKYDEE